MPEKVILRSMTVDHHGDFIPFKMMEDYANTINGNHKMRYLINHRTDIPPLGYFDNAEIKEIDKIINVIAEPIMFKNRSEASFDTNLIIEEAEKPIFFIKSENTNFQILVDKNNFKNIIAYQNTVQKLRQLYNEEFSLQLSMRKSLIPDPQVVVVLANYYIFLHPLIKPFLNKMGEKFAEEITEDLYRICKSNAKSVVSKLSETFKIVRQNMIPKEKYLHTIFEIPGSPKIELHIKSNDATKIEKGLKATNLFRVHEKVINFKKIMDISEIHFLLNSKDRWEFSYLITDDGKILGSKNSFKKRDELLSKIKLSPTKAFSVGANGVKYGIRKNEINQ